jgi:AraC-like DNA-binding protein
MRYQPLGMPPKIHGRLHEEDFTDPSWASFIERHAHSFVEAHLLVRGSAVVVVNGSRVDLTVGSLLWIPPRSEHVTLVTSPTLRRWNLCMRVAAVQRILTRDETALLLSRRAGVRYAQLGRVELQSLVRVLTDVATQTSRGESVANAGLGYAFTRAVVAFQETGPSHEFVSLHPGVARALALLKRDGLSLTRDELAARCGVSATHLSRLFVQELGQTLRDVRNRKRLARFEELMSSGYCYSLTDAALEAGFGSYSQFHRVFTRSTGRSPSGRVKVVVRPTPE